MITKVEVSQKTDVGVKLICADLGLEITRPMSLKFRLLSFLTRNTLSRKHDVD